jgi:nucleoside recognition membrane protein YjiH
MTSTAAFAFCLSLMLVAVVFATAGVNFTNILRAAFRVKAFCAAFMCLQFGFVMFWQKDLGTKAAHKMLVKLTPGNALQGQTL